MLSPEILQAAADLRWLFNRGYPQTASIKIVGDRHRLSKAKRQMLYRGVASSEAADRRRDLIARPGNAAGGRLGVDGHNVVLTIANYISGIPVFEADDGIIRDIGALHGRIHDRDVMERSLNLTAAALLRLDTAQLTIVFDAPISHSRDHAAYLESKFKSCSGVGTGGRADVRADLSVVPSGDRALKDAAIDFIATSDSALIDAVGIPVIDLARFVLEEEFHPVFDTFVSVVN